MHTLTHTHTRTNTHTHGHTHAHTLTHTRMQTCQHACSQQDHSPETLQPLQPLILRPYLQIDQIHLINYPTQMFYFTGCGDIRDACMYAPNIQTSLHPYKHTYMHLYRGVLISDVSTFRDIQVIVTSDMPKCMLPTLKHTFILTYIHTNICIFCIFVRLW